MSPSPAPGTHGGTPARGGSGAAVVTTPALVGALFLVLIAMAAAVRPAVDLAGLPSAGTVADGRATGPFSSRDVTLGRLPPVAEAGLQLLAGLALTAAIILLVRRLVGVWRALQAERRARVLLRLPGQGPAGATAVTDAVADAAAAAVADLDAADSEDVSDAVVRAWVRIETVAGEAGAARRSVQTATEYAADLLRRGMVRTAAIDTLLRVYSAARFGAAPLPAVDVAAAREAFAAVHDDLAGRHRGAGLAG